MAGEHGEPGQRLSDPAHPAAGEPPRTGLAAGVADVVVEHHVGGAARPGPGPGPDHPGDRQQPAHGVAFEVPVDEVGDAAGEQAGDVDGAPLVEPAQVPEQQPLAPQVGRPPRPQPRRDLVKQGPEDGAEVGQVRLVAVVGRGVPLGEPRDLGPALRRVGGQAEIPPVRPGREVRTLREHVVTVAGQPQVTDQARWQQRDHVRQRGHRVVGPERMLAHRRPAEHTAPLADQRAEPAAREIRRGDQPVVTSADHHHIRARWHGLHLMRARARAGGSG